LDLVGKYSSVLPPGPGVCINDIGPDQVPESEVIRHFGPKSSKSGWKYFCQQTPEQADSIYDLWRRVYNERLMPNKEISLQFARGLILQSRDVPVDWVGFAVARDRYRTSVRVSKGKGAMKFEEVTRPGGKVSILGKRRCVAATPPPIVCLTLKEEVIEEDEMVQKMSTVGKVRPRGKGLVEIPRWENNEVSEMVSGIAGCEKLIVELRAELVVRTHEKESSEAEVRRARMTLCDRKVVFAEAQAALKTLVEEETSLKAQVSKNRLSLATRDSCEALEESLLADETSIEHNALNRRIEERTLSLSGDVICGYEGTIERVEGELVKSKERFAEVVCRVTALESVLGSMGQQLWRMQEGSGHTFFPQPIFSNP
jgi:hypothetical protein